ncbi:hypothetical protein PR202_gb02802 [Eleusine coracana subsp. coracana]|uniref:Uncharacterized protein n=1 Tax=Eleusine coracana subsp. coracana TaxID=191504 RepID=A0AAV5DZD9_ELECO|nr:hypothetical protein PR202_gb02802 [Eleusine coracana subsp. coracana]
MMGSRVAAALLRRGRDQASALIVPRLPISPPAPAVPRVGSGSLGGVGGGHLLPPRLGSVGPASSASRFASFHAFRSFAPKTLLGQCTRRMSTTAAALNSAAANGTANSGLKLLVTKGPQAQKAVGIWLFGCAAWVFSLVILGGITRLTRSGLSMTDWKFTGEIPPMSNEAWMLEFEKYKQSPEYKRSQKTFMSFRSMMSAVQSKAMTTKLKKHSMDISRVNKGMSLEDFKFIYWMEYGHRMWGRTLGFVFAVPFAYFVAKGYVTRQLGLRLSALFALGGGQGLIGWWMVKSGLEEPTSEYVQPRVSPYRLATHLTSAFVIYCGILWTALSVVMPDPPTGSMNWVNGAAKIRKLAIPVSAIVGITAISGAFVAGNDAGHAYNSFPKMGDTWIPEDVFSYVGNIYTLDVCSNIFGLSSPGWSIDSTVTDDPSHAHSKETLASPSKVTCNRCEINLILFQKF